YETLKDLWGGDSDLELRMAAQIGGTLIGQVAASALALKAQEHFVPIWQKYSEEDLAPFKAASISYSSFVFMQFLFDSILETTLNWGQISFSKIAEDKLRAQYSEDLTLLKLASLNQSETRVQNLFRETKEVVEVGLTLQSSGVSALTKTLYYGWVLQGCGALGMIAWMKVIEQSGIYASYWIAYKQQEEIDRFRQVNVKIERLQMDLMSKSGQLVSSNRTKELRQSLELLVAERQEIEGRQRLWGGILPLIKKHMGSFEYVAKYVYVAYWALEPARRGNLENLKKQAGKIVSVGFEFSRSLAWPADNAANIQKTTQNLQSVKTVMDWMKEPIRTSYFEVSEASKAGLKIWDAEVGVGDKNLMKVPKMTLEPGRHVLVGPNGCGKSTLFRQIYGLRDHQTWSKGKLSKPENIVFLPQQIYLMPHQTLAASVGMDLREEACEKVGVCNKDWDEVQSDWGSVLSAGECKKLALLAALKKNPDILILDEIFAEMDRNSRAQSQALIRSMALHAVVLIVDHEYESRNKDRFYDHVWEVSGGSLACKAGCS
ncbi:MAG: ATP-binding cassette domain-containing protein, partial [Deltaproteobacteria bacterium]|nr:ATP-binding cassette domain-containing protein [Deltaproteobacteria bacterium]